MGERDWYAEDRAVVKAAHPGAMCMRREFGTAATGLRRDTFVVVSEGEELHQPDIAESEATAWKLARIAVEEEKMARQASSRFRARSAVYLLTAAVLALVLGADLDGDGHNSLWDIVHWKPFLTVGRSLVVQKAEAAIKGGEHDLTCMRLLKDQGGFGPVTCFQRVAGPNP